MIKTNAQYATPALPLPHVVAALPDGHWAKSLAEPVQAHQLNGRTVYGDDMAWEHHLEPLLKRSSSGTRQRDALHEAPTRATVGRCSLQPANPGGWIFLARPLAGTFRAACCALALTLIVGFSPTVRGETPPSAEELWNWYGEASRLHDQGKINEAWKLYKKIWKYKQSYDVAAAMGEICSRRAQFALAARYYRFAIETVVPTQSPQFVQAVNEEYEKARREVTEVELHVKPEGVDDLRVFDEQNDVELAQPLFLEVGNHRLRAEAPGYASVTKFVAAQPGALVEWDIELTPLSSVVPDEPRTNKTRHPALVFGVGGAVTLGLGTGAFWMAKQAREQYDDGTLAGATLERGECSTNRSPRCAELDEAYARAERSQNIAIGLGAGAGLTALTTVLVYWLWQDEETVSVSLSPTPGDGWKVGLSHAF